MKMMLVTGGFVFVILAIGFAAGLLGIVAVHMAEVEEELN